MKIEEYKQLVEEKKQIEIKLRNASKIEWLLADIEHLKQRINDFKDKNIDFMFSCKAGRWNNYNGTFIEKYDAKLVQSDEWVKKMFIQAYKMQIKEHEKELEEMEM